MNIKTPRLLLIPFTHQVCTTVLAGDHTELHRLGLTPGPGWPDEETLDTLPRILKNLALVEGPTGFESWMIVKKDGLELIGDTGFKGLPNPEGEIDIGYGILEAEQKKGYALEAAQGLIRWAFSRPEVKAITARCAADNLGSARILEKLHFTQVAQDLGMRHWVLEKISPWLP